MVQRGRLDPCGKPLGVIRKTRLRVNTCGAIVGKKTTERQKNHRTEGKTGKCGGVRKKPSGLEQSSRPREKGNVNKKKARLRLRCGERGKRSVFSIGLGSSSDGKQKKESEVEAV